MPLSKLAARSRSAGKQSRFETEQLTTDAVSASSAAAVLAALTAEAAGRREGASLQFAWQSDSSCKRM